jgi:type IV pilus assembly protein PilE
MRQMSTRRNRASGGFTLVELLVVVTILGLLAIIAIPQLFKTREKGVRKEGMTNIMNIAGAMERYYSDGRFSYSTGTSNTCPGTSSAYADGTVIGDLALAIQGAYYSYTIAVTDPNSDNLCENYTITATGTKAPVTGQTLSYTQAGVKTGNWN